MKTLATLVAVGLVIAGLVAFLRGDYAQAAALYALAACNKIDALGVKQ